MRLTVFGATGRTGRPLVEQALARAGVERFVTFVGAGVREEGEFVLDCLEAELYVREMPKIADA
jgi:dihydrodipicolinate reductase